MLIVLIATAAHGQETPVEVEEPAPEVTVKARRTRAEIPQVRVTAEEAEDVPGTQGDALKVVQVMPGVSRPALGSGELVVWGSAPRETRVYVDGIELPMLYHLGGVRSTVGTALVSSVDLMPGGFGVEYGRGLGGVVRVQTRALPDEAATGVISADFYDTSAFVSAAPTSRLRLGLGGRWGYFERVVTLVDDAALEHYPIPRYHDGQLVASLDLRSGESLHLLVLRSVDDLTRQVGATDPHSARVEDTHRSFHRVALRYERVLGKDSTARVSVWAGDDHGEVVGQFGPVPIESRERARSYGMRGLYHTRLSPRFTLGLGMDLLSTRSELHRFGSLTLPAREGDVTVFGQPPGDDVNADDWTVTVGDVAPHAYVEARLGPLLVTPGLRADAFFLEGSRITPRVGLTPAIGFLRTDWTLDPRLLVTWPAHRRLVVSMAAGRYHQAPDPADLSAVFGSPHLGVASGRHLRLGGVFTAAERLDVEVTGFSKTMSGLAVRSAEAMPVHARLLEPEGEGRSYGVQLLVRQRLTGGLFGWLSYTYTRSERQDHPGEEWRAFDYDQPHVLTAVGSWSWHGWTFGGRFRFSSGAPRTPVEGAYYDARLDRYQPTFGAHNSIRVPAFAQLDLRVERGVDLTPRARVELYVDAQNVLARENAEEIVYSDDYSEKLTLASLPTHAIVGAKVTF